MGRADSTEEKREYAFRVTTMLEKVRDCGGALLQAASEASNEARNCANELLLVEKLLAALPAVMAKHCCAPTWQRRSMYAETRGRSWEPHGCTKACTAVWQRLDDLGLVERPKEDVR